MNEPCWREGRRSSGPGPGMAAVLQASQPRTKAGWWASGVGGGGGFRPQRSLGGLWLSAGASQDGLCWLQEDSLGATPSTGDPCRKAAPSAGASGSIGTSHVVTRKRSRRVPSILCT